MRTYPAGAFIGEHGSWDRSPLSGYVVSYVTFENGKPVCAPKDVVTGAGGRCAQRDRLPCGYTGANTATA
ncbi:hypothetical protein AB3X96_32120 [Paraburkholderia sp. BR13439]|uniref:hypothetical protein n=1 Tax=Paraburkholderia TaxID=1822464 RepID=UPI0034CFC1AE